MLMYSYLWSVEKVIIRYYSTHSMPYLSTKMHGKIPKVLKTLALEKSTNFFFPILSSNIELLAVNSQKKYTNLNVFGKKSQNFEKG